MYNIYNKVLLHETVFRPTLLYAAPVWGSGGNTNIQELHILQNELLRYISKQAWYVRNEKIHHALKIGATRKIIKHKTQNF